MIWKLLYRMIRRENGRLRTRNAQLEHQVNVLRDLLQLRAIIPRLTIVRRK